MITFLFVLAITLLIYGILNSLTLQKYLDECAKTQDPFSIKIENEGFALGTIIGCHAIKEVYHLVLFTLVISIVLFAIALYEQYRYEVQQHR